MLFGVQRNRDGIDTDSESLDRTTQKDAAFLGIGEPIAHGCTVNR
jgi:hypothetical protein